MQNKRKIGRRRKESIARRRKFVVFLLVVMFFIVSGTTFKIFTTLKNTVVATSAKETFDIMGTNNPINLALNDEIRVIEEEKAKAKVELERKTIRLADQERNKDKKIAYLTFDDGPSRKVTPVILDILAKYNIKATFFVVGRVADANPEMLKKVHEEGHTIGHHSYTHDYKYLYKSIGNFTGELNKTAKTFKRILGEDFESKLVRFPGGSFEKSKQKFVNATSKLGYSNYDWNALNGDAEGHGLPKAKLISRLKESSKGKKEIIVLMHDTDAKQTTADALPEIIKHLIKEGYEFRTLDQY